MRRRGGDRRRGLGEAEWRRKLDESKSIPDTWELSVQEGLDGDQGGDREGRVGEDPGDDLF